VIGNEEVYKRGKIRKRTRGKKGDVPERGEGAGKNEGSARGRLSRKKSEGSNLAVGGGGREEGKKRGWKG